MSLARQIAKQFRDVYSGGNWTASNLKETLADINWQQSTTKVYNFNSIAMLVFHINYYVEIVTKALQNESLKGSDKYSFDPNPVNSKEDWENLQNRLWTAAENFAVLIENLPDTKLEEIFYDVKYGTYYRNLHGIIEHIHYHLGQIVLIKKIIRQKYI